MDAEFIRPRPTERLEVIEVDGAGRPKRVLRQDLLTGGEGMMEYEGGYRPQAGAKHEYSPLDALRRPEDD